MPDSLTSVSCSHCGAPLQVPDTTHFVTCSYCGTRLEVHRSGNAVYTEILADIDQRTQQIASDVDTIKRQNEIERLDREWQMQREGLLQRDKYGRASEPSAVGGMIGSVIAVVFGVIWMIVASSSGAPGFFVLFGLVFIGAAVIGGISSLGKAAQFNDAQQSYQQRRQQLMNGDRDNRS
jgi:hypothetical protein